MVTYLKPEFDSRKSFYNKAVVKIENNKKTLYSYNTKICSIVDNVFHKYWNGYSATTMRHISEFRLQNGLPAMGKKEWENLEVEDIWTWR